MSNEEKSALKINILKLTQDQKKGIVPIVQECVSKNGANPIFEFELDQLSTECLRKLEVYVNKNVSYNRKRDNRRKKDKEKRDEIRRKKEEQEKKNKDETEKR